MLIRDFSLSNIAGDMGEDSEKRKYGIYKCSRTIFVFTTQEEYKTKNFVKAKACIINECAYNSALDISHPIKINDGIILRKAVYFGDIIIPDVIGNIQSPEAFFSLDNVITNERASTLYNGEVNSFGPSTFSTRMNGIDIYDKMMLPNFMTGDSIPLPPNFYTEYEMTLKEGEFVSLEEDMFLNKTNMRKLIDNSTTIQFMDIIKYDTMRLEYFGQLEKVESSERGMDSIIKPCCLGTAFNQFMGTGASFIYDSDAFGMGKEGVNVKGGKVSLKDFVSAPWLQNHISSALNIFSMDCKDFEKEYGHIRVYYNPSSLGDKYKIKFKENAYDLQNRIKVNDFIIVSI